MSAAKVKITVMAPKLYELPYHHIDAIKELHPVTAIRFIRAEMGLSLLEAKNLVDTITGKCQ